MSIQEKECNWEEILSIRIILTHNESRTNGNKRTVYLYFTGYCETKYFRGTVLPGACDTQEFVDDVLTSICADYTLDGLDPAGNHCTLHIINRRVGDEFIPVIHTANEQLAWLCDADLRAQLEDGDWGPTVRIYATKSNVPTDIQ